jgi:hypothetical protein
MQRSAYLYRLPGVLLTVNGQLANTFGTVQRNQHNKKFCWFMEAENMNNRTFQLLVIGCCSKMQHYAPVHHQPNVKLKIKLLH